MQPARLADALPKLATELGDNRSELNPLVRTVLDRRPDSSEVLLRAWLGASTPTSWRAFLSALPLDSPPPGQVTVVIEALSSMDAGIREATVWNMVVRVAQGRPAPAAVLEAVLSTRGLSVAAAEGAAPTWELLGREIIARRHGNKKTPDRAALITAEASHHAMDSRALAVLDEITGPERKALQAVLGDQFPKKASDMRASAPIVKRGDAMRTVPTIWPGLLRGLVETTGCKPGGDAPLPGVVAVAYRGGTAASGRLPSTRGCLPNATRSLAYCAS